MENKDIPAGIPAGIYRAVFLGTELRQQQGGGERLRWNFRIAAGPHTGGIVHAQARRGTLWIKRQLSEAVDGKPLEDSVFHPVLYEGALVRVIIWEGVNGGRFVREVVADRPFRVRAN